MTLVKSFVIKNALDNVEDDDSNDNDDDGGDDDDDDGGGGDDKGHYFLSSTYIPDTVLRPFPIYIQFYQYNCEVFDGCFAGGETEVCCRKLTQSHIARSHPVKVEVSQISFVRTRSSPDSCKMLS